MKLSTLVLAVAFTLTACGGSDSSTAIAASEESRLQKKSEPIAVDTTGVDTTPQTSMSTPSGGVRAMDLICSLLCFVPSLTLIGTVVPPQVNLQGLQAADVAVNGTKAYVAYNMAGVTESGGIDVIDFSAAGVPSLKASTTFADTDVNKIFVDGANSKIYLTGNRSTGDSGAVLYRYGLDAAGLLSATRETKMLRSAADATLPAHTGTSVIASGSSVYAVTGVNGGLSILNASDLSDSGFTSIPDARDIALMATNTLLIVSGQTTTIPARVSSYSSSGVYQAATNATTFTGSVVEPGKSSLFVGGTAYVASGGQGGVKFVCNDGTSVGSMPIPAIAGLSSSESAANAVTYGNGIVYVAQGGAGVYMYAVQNSLLGLGGCAGLSLNFVGKFTFGSRASANNVYYSNGYLIVATGNSGFQIIQVTQSLVAGLLQVL